ncbi:hypothetical protein ACH5RR_033845 [Cinchona calisaya]|uniref:Uncharacterized protein n=1 Tax=Cinchona calisaya TaxID=153742 RepID=A0ABD2YD00_9GENT
MGVSPPKSRHSESPSFRESSNKLSRVLYVNLLKSKSKSNPSLVVRVENLKIKIQVFDTTSSNQEPVKFEKATKRLGDAKARLPYAPLAIKFELFNAVVVKLIALLLVIGKLLDQKDIRTMSSESTDIEGEGRTLVTRRRRRIFGSSPKLNRSLVRSKMVKKQNVKKVKKDNGIFNLQTSHVAKKKTRVPITLKEFMSC